MNYHDPSIWKNYDQDNQSAARIEVIRRLIPNDVSSILDAGCGNGLITNAFVDNYQITGIDTSSEALKYLRCPAQQASVTAIPFSNDSFDLVMCNEVLEHLNTASLIMAISELKRVSSKYILISVPHKEQLENLLSRCAICGFTEHPYGHRQSFGMDILNSYLKPEYEIVSHDIFGPPTRNFIPLLLRIKQNVFHQWFQPYANCTCSRCGSTSFQNSRSVFTKLINGQNKVLVRSRPYWLMVLYKKQTPNA